MPSVRTLSFIAAFAGAFIYLVTSLDRAGRASDCAALATRLADLQASAELLAKVDTTSAKKSRSDLGDVSSKLKGFTTELDNLTPDVREIRSAKSEVSVQLTTLAHGLDEITRGLANENIDTTQRGQKEALEAAQKLPDAIEKLRVLCVE